MTSTDTRPPAGTTVWLLNPDGSGGPSSRFPGSFTVARLLRKNIEVVRKDADGEVILRVTAAPALVVTEEPAATAIIAYRAPWDQGQVVHWAGAPVHKTGTTLFVVIRDDGGPAVNRIAVLGGNEGRYWPRVPATELEAITPADIARYLTGDTTAIAAAAGED